MSGTGAHEPLVACVLVTWNNWTHTRRCLAALQNQEYKNLLVIVVDNGSSDDSLIQLRSNYPLVLSIENGDNLGFSKACNIGARAAIERGAEFLWFLNNDTEAPPDTLRKLANQASHDAQTGIVGSVLFFLDEPSKVQAWGGGQIDLWSGYNRHFTRPRAFGRGTYVTFASALVRRQTFEALGGFWEGLFLYFEDSDFSLRAKQAGWTLAIAEDTAVLHAEGGSVHRRNPLLDRIQTRSGIAFLLRHGRVPWISAGVFVVLRLGRRIARRDWPGLRAVLQGVGDARHRRITPFREGA